MRNRSHLRATLDLKHTDRIRLAKRLVNKRVFRERGKVNLFVVVARDQLDGILEHGHHAEAEQVHFDEAEVGAIFFVPLDHSAARHGGALDGDNAIEHSGADDHSAGMLAKMTRQALHSLAEVKIAGDAWMANIEACLREVMSHCVVLAAPLPVADKACEARELVRLEAKRIAHFTRR